LKFRLSNKNILAASFVGLLLIGLSASTATAYQHVKSRLQLAVQAEIQLKAKYVVNELKHWTRDTIAQVEHFALFLGRSENDLTKHPRFDKFAEWYPNKVSLQYLGYIIDSDGYYSITDWQVPDEYDARNRSWYIEGKAANKSKFGQPYISIENNEQAWLAVTSPIHQQGKFIGLASAHVMFDRMLSVLHCIEVGMAGKAFLVDQQGQVVLPKLQHVDDIWPKQAGLRADGSLVEGILPQSVSSTHTFYVTKTIDSLTGHIVFAIPNEVVSKKVYQGTLALLAKFLVIFLAVMIALYFSNRHLLAPLFDYLELDSITLLPSKKHFKQQVEQQFLLPKQKGRLLIINMEDFNRITASYPAIHVNLLQNKIKERVQLQLAEPSLLGNFSESRFIAYYQVNDVADDELLMLLTSALAEHYEIAGSEIYCNFRIGASDYPEHGQNIETLIDNAFSALASVSRQYSNNYSVFTAQINQKFCDAQQIHNAMKKGLSAGEFSMVYQPQIDVLTGRVFAVESLVRWHSTLLNRNVSPTEFIPIAESSGLMVLLGDNITRQVFRQLMQWNVQGIDVSLVSINISTQQLLAADFYDNLLINCQDFNVSPMQIELEITETCLLKNPEDIIALLNKLNLYGFSIAIDDFGTGYSSLEYLNSMPLHKLKIDRAFVVDLDKKEKSAVLVKTIVAMANNLNLDVLAEGVERAGEAEALLTLGCSKIQGYLYSKPLIAKDLEVYIEENS
jgi:EAL domain-containing protein (putative c-di-GMP-specific phosphodiesterase class I)/GGDEF domain-containing protein